MVMRQKIINSDWNIDADGFLRCRTTVLKAGVMSYSPCELAGVPENLKHKEVINLLVPPEELCSPKAIKSLEGKPIVANKHEWQEAGAMCDVGNVAGTPQANLPYLYADILVTDPETIEQIKSRELVEQSGAYDSVIVWESGTTDNGEEFDGIQREYNFNHVSILPAGCGRGGKDVRILNHNNREEKPMEFTTVKFGKSRIRVCNEDMDAFDKESEKKDDDMKKVEDEKKDVVENSVDQGQFEEVLEQLKTMTAAKEELEGKLAQMQEQLESALSADMIEEQAQVMNEEREEAEKVMNSYGVKLDKTKRLRGHDLRVHVVNSVRIKNGRSELKGDSLKEGFVTGMYKQMAETITVEPKMPVGSSIVKVENSASQNNVFNLSASDKVSKMYGGGK